MQLENSNIKNSRTQYFLMLALIVLGISISAISIITQLIISAINIPNIIGEVINDHNLWAPLGSKAKIWETLSKFTTQSNILVLIFFSLVLINYLAKTKNKWINSYFNLAVTIYISITLIIFWTTLFKPMLETTNFQTTIGIISFVNSFLSDLFIPIITIAFYFLTAGNKKWALQITTIKALPIIISYMFIYLTYALVKGTFVGEIKTKGDNSFIDYSYPYFFLNIKTNINTFIVYFFIILFLFLILFALYYTYNNWKYQKKYGKKLATKKEQIKAILF